MHAGQQKGMCLAINLQSAWSPVEVLFKIHVPVQTGGLYCKNLRDLRWQYCICCNKLNCHDTSGPRQELPFQNILFDMWVPGRIPTQEGILPGTRVPTPDCWYLLQMLQNVGSLSDENCLNSRIHPKTQWLVAKRVLDNNKIVIITSALNWRRVGPGMCLHAILPGVCYTNLTCSQSVPDQNTNNIHSLTLHL